MLPFCSSSSCGTVTILTIAGIFGFSYTATALLKAAIVPIVRE